jgi:protein TonB
MKLQESVPVPRGWTGETAWKGAGASLLLHLFAGAAVIVALSGPPSVAPQVIDLTLLPPAEIGRRPVPSAFAAAEPPGTAVLPEQPAISGLPAHADRHAVSTPGRSDAAVEGSGPVAPFPPSSPIGTASGAPPSAAASARAATGEGGGKETTGNRVGKTSPGSPAGDFAWIRDPIQRAIAYPATARRMGWEGKVVVAFQLLSDGSVRDVRVVQGSGHTVLDRGAVDAVRNASPFPRSPVEAEIITPVLFLLTPAP